MGNASHDFVSVDMRGLKAALVARARMRRVSVSSIVRSAVERELGAVAGSAPSSPESDPIASSTIKLSIRMSAAEAMQLVDGAREAGISRGAYIAALVAGGAVLSRRADHLGALTASGAELATLSRNIGHLTALLRQGSVRAAQQYLAMLDSLTTEVRRHLNVAADALADLRPARDARKAPTEQRGRQHV